MLNSPTLCQYFVNKALLPFHQKFPHLLIYHYMDDILLVGQNIIDEILQMLQKVLLQSGLHVATEKIQCQLHICYFKDIQFLISQI